MKRWHNEGKSKLKIMEPIDCSETQLEAKPVIRIQEEHVLERNKKKWNSKP